MSHASCEHSSVMCRFISCYMQYVYMCPSVVLSSHQLERRSDLPAVQHLEYPLLASELKGVHRGVQFPLIVVPGPQLGFYAVRAGHT